MSEKIMYVLTKIIRKLSILFFLLSIIIFMTYLFGNYQYFLDITQLVLLKLFKICAFTFIFTGIYYIVFLIIEAIRSKKNKIINLGIIITAEVVIVFLYIITDSIIVLSGTVI